MGQGGLGCSAESCSTRAEAEVLFEDPATCSYPCDECCMEKGVSHCKVRTLRDLGPRATSDTPSEDLEEDTVVGEAAVLPACALKDTDDGCCGSNSADASTPSMRTLSAFCSQVTSSGAESAPTATLSSAMTANSAVDSLTDSVAQQCEFSRNSVDQWIHSLVLWNREERETRRKVRRFLFKHGFEGTRSKQNWFFTKRDWFPLHCAVKWNDAEMVRLLLRACADPSQRNGTGQKPLDYALSRDRRGSYRQVVELLQQPDPDKLLSEFERTGPPAKWRDFFSELGAEPISPGRGLL